MSALFKREETSLLDVPCPGGHLAKPDAGHLICPVSHIKLPHSYSPKTNEPEAEATGSNNCDYLSLPLPTRQVFFLTLQRNGNRSAFALTPSAQLFALGTDAGEPRLRPAQGKPVGAKGGTRRDSPAHDN
ncbi:hypothetical protein IAD21_01799 [Abditibacteriota bacterium]|nr:hypothetical protein IAD21_01799 [Abditibacteriota bacterium]